MGFQAYLREYETDEININGQRIKRIRRNSAYGINRKMSGIRGLFGYLYKNDMISKDEYDKLINNFTELLSEFKSELNIYKVTSRKVKYQKIVNKLLKKQAI